VQRARGARAVALITGEEKILPPNPSYFVCTVESMPLDRPVDFLAVDEIQLCADPERGHVFTARLMHARGLMETMFLGADTIKPLIDSKYRTNPADSGVGGSSLGGLVTLYLGLTRPDVFSRLAVMSPSVWNTATSGGCAPVPKVCSVRWFAS